ncbi:MAG: alpha/beta hydrolase fold protein [Actinomycetia bacterium]|nr:alpha/beta hydrolase fold protein [Actinomycetes bacterium]
MSDPLREVTARTPDGRKLGAVVIGAPDAPALFFLHGTPGSRWLHPEPAVVADAGIRLVTYDRPGYGRSDRNPGRSLLDSGIDAAAIADALELERFSVVGVSGGGPHALGITAALGNRIRGFGVVSSPGPLDEVPDAWDALSDHMRPTAEMARREPARSVRAIERFMAPVVANPASSIPLGKQDPNRAVLNDPDVATMMIRQAEEGLRVGAGGMADDMITWWRPWGFALADLPPGAQVWHGAHDLRAAPDIDTYARELRGARVTRWADDGHFGVLAHWPEVLGAFA